MVRTTVGYTGGVKPDPTYRSLGDHTETVEVEYDPARVSYEELLAVFWESHDPTGQTWARQYRNAVFWHGEGQRKAVEASRGRLAARLGKAVKTDAEPAGRFYPAEGYHQKYTLKLRPELWAEVRSWYGSDAEAESSTAAARLNGYLGGNGAPSADDLEFLGLSPRGRELLDAVVRRFAD